jgi:hypothetical protein
MRKYLYTVLGLLFVSLAACQGTTESSPPAATEVSEPTAVPAAVDAPVSAGLASCSVVSILPSAEPTEQARFTAAEESDWKRGAETATVTIINYGDFQ